MMKSKEIISDVVTKPLNHPSLQEFRNLQDDEKDGKMSKVR